MPQKNTWEKEYSNAKLVILENDKPQKNVLRYFRFLKKQGIILTNLSILDLGCGIGKNSNYLAELGNDVAGIDISKNAIKTAKDRANKLKLDVKYMVGNIGSKFLFENEYFDLVLDNISSNSLDDQERNIYIKEVNRVLKKNGNFFIKALCKEGDKNAKYLLKHSPGKDPDTYIMREINLTEKVFSKDSFIQLYSKYFEIEQLIKKTSYVKINNRNYKRNYWLGYMKKI